MQEKETIFQDVFETISTGIFVVEIDSRSDREPENITFRYLTANPAYRRMLLKSTVTLAGLSPHECFPPDIADKFCANYRRCLEQRQSISYRETLELGQHRCTLLTTLFPKLEPDGRIAQVIGSSDDITERKRQEEEQKRAEDVLAQEKKLLATLIKNAPVGIISTDEFGRILLVNPAYERICGYSSEELIGQTPPYPYWDLADLEMINQEFLLAMSGEKEQIELWFTRKNGERFLARLQPITIFDEQGNMLRHLATMEDITQYKQAEEELHKALETERELNELKSRFIAMISHEYRTPLAIILSSAEILERYRHQLTEERQLKHYRRIQSAVHTLTQLVSDVLALSKIEAGKQEFNPSPLDLEQFCRELVEDLQLTIASQHMLTFSTQGNCTLAASETPCMDAKLLRYIINNLLSNAIKYSPQGSTIQFSLTCDRGKVILRIQDEGIGIPPENRQHLFESFYRGSNVGTIAGSGLGLTIVKNAVDLHAGTIAVESEVGVGTTFTVTLPLNPV